MLSHAKDYIENIDKVSTKYMKNKTKKIFKKERSEIKQSNISNIIANLNNNISVLERKIEDIKMHQMKRVFDGDGGCRRGIEAEGRNQCCLRGVRWDESRAESEAFRAAGELGNDDKIHGDDDDEDDENTPALD